MACCMFLLRREKKLLWNGSPLHLGDATCIDQEDLVRLIKRNVDVGLAPWKRLVQTRQSCAEERSNILLAAAMDLIGAFCSFSASESMQTRDSVCLFPSEILTLDNYSSLYLFYLLKSTVSICQVGKSLLFICSRIYLLIHSRKVV